MLERAVRPLGRLLRSRRADPALSVRALPPYAAPATIEVTSASFEPGGPIGTRQAGPGRGDNLSPQLTVAGLPAATAQLLLIMEDPDVPLRRPVLHMIALLDPGSTDFAEGALTPDNPHVTWVPAFQGRTGYAGPRALPGHGVHRYGFHVYALDEVLPRVTSFAGLTAAVEGHVLARGCLEGTQEG
ncbi:YbhB/YbcL family Raf kinase inhibitor-like protein [Actinoplanes sp. RD1]|uniref:YbhB/YbcL family Raf kinase inhibitor-like protein n=1 Tax=Actinoplanes sp. RD1 TaxID=3064538 RepID=UPI0027427343|nr:YbhB/YbcL family Raf kinase inhibitor-like protein [Actinoplanes sp. RD1]